MTASDVLHVVYPARDEQLDEEMRKLTADHPGIAARVGAALDGAAGRTAAAATRGARRTLAHGWARVRGCLGSLGGVGTATAAVYVGWGLVPGMLATAVALLVGEKLLEDPKVST